jgi:GT2 family glycosyltransferase
MIRPITFCIPTANNEKDYTLLLLESLKNNTDIDKHEILIFVDSDNQKTYESLLEKKKEFKNLRIYKNDTDYPFGSQRNVSIMFDAASNDIVCYLQSDMVVGKNLDFHISNDLSSEMDILSLTRIEPPLHPPSKEKIVKDFGIDALTFDMKSFNTFVEELQSENRPIELDAHFAPFALHKKLWFETIGGFDTQFRCSREDSDFIIRCKLNKINLIQTWKGAVYHFTCVSSRGKDWFKQDDEKINIKNELQRLADYQELLRFTRKWGKFGHNVDYLYDISFVINVDRYVDFNILSAVEPLVSRLFINDESVVNNLIHSVKFQSEYYSNLRWNYSNQHWKNVCDRFNPTKFEDRIIYHREKDEVFGDIIVSCDYSELHNDINNLMQIISSLNDLVNQNDIGVYEFGPMKFNINKKINKIESLKKLNTDWNKLLNNPICLFK